MTLERGERMERKERSLESCSSSGLGGWVVEDEDVRLDDDGVDIMVGN